MTTLIQTYNEIEKLVTLKEAGEPYDKERLEQLRKQLDRKPGKETASEYDKWKEVAIANRIPREYYWRRVKKNGWDMERAATQPVMRKTPTADESEKRVNPYGYWAGVAVENGINKSVFWRRVNTLNWDIETAATKEVKKTPGGEMK